MAIITTRPEDKLWPKSLHAAMAVIDRDVAAIHEAKATETERVIKDYMESNAAAANGIKLKVTVGPSGEILGVEGDWKPVKALESEAQAYNERLDSFVDLLKEMEAYDEFQKSLHLNEAAVIDLRVKV